MFYTMLAGFLGFAFSTFWAVIFLFIWIAFAFWPARVASRKGYSWLLFFILSLFLFVIMLIVAYVIPDKVPEEIENEVNEVL